MQENNNEDLRELHDEAIAPKTDLELANDININGLKESDIKEIKRSVLVKALELRGINHDTLNLSPSAFGKMNKNQLAAILKDDNGKASPEAQKEGKKEQTQGGEGKDVFALALEFKELISRASKSGDYKELDSVVAGTVLTSASNSDIAEDFNTNNPLVRNIVIGIGVTYLAARLYGFDNIKEKFNQVRNKHKKATNEQSTDQQNS